MSSAVLFHKFNESYKNIIINSQEKKIGLQDDFFSSQTSKIESQETKDTSNQSKSVIEKLLNLLTDPHSCQLYERHTHQLKKLTKQFSTGFLLKDMKYLACIIAAIGSNIANYIDILPSYIDLLTIFGHPFIKCLTSDELNFKDATIEAISQFGYLMALPYNQIRYHICKSLLTLYTTNKKIKQDLNVVSKEYLKNIIDESSICSTMIQSISLINFNGDVLLILMELIKELTNESIIGSNRAICSDGALQICNILTADLGKATKQIKYICTEVIWNLVEHADVNLVNQGFNNVECISAIKEAFIELLNSSIGEHEREFRNDLMSICSLLFQIIENSKYILLSGYAKYIALLATYQEVKNHNILVKHLKLTSKSKEDFELKKLLLDCLISIYKNEEEIIQLYSENNVIPAMLYHLQPSLHENSDIQWKDYQIDEIQLLCLKVLSVVGKDLITIFMQCHGPKCLLEYIDYCVDSEMKTSATSQSSFINPLQQLYTKIDNVQSCILAIKNIILSKDKDIVDEFAMHGIFERCLALLQVLSVTASYEIVYVQTQIDIMDILAEICIVDTQYKEMFGPLGVDLLFPRLNVNLKEIDDIYIKLVASAVNCLWSTVIANFSLEIYFMENSGILTLLNQLETSPEILKNLFIGCLLDLSSNPKSLKHILLWKGKGGISAAHLFCELWRAEDDKLHVPRNLSKIVDLEHPLKSEQIHELQIHEYPSASVNDVFTNIRAKIYGLFSIMGFIDLPQLEHDDHVTLTIIQNYMNLKVAEIWDENSNELQNEHLRPITPDEESLKIIKEGSRMRVEEILKTQEELIQAYEAQEIQQEQQCYIQIRELHLQEEYEMKKFNEYLKRTSNYNFLKESKNRMMSAINASRKSSGYTKSNSFQKTTLDNLNITNFPGKKLQINTKQHVIN